MTRQQRLDMFAQVRLYLVTPLAPQAGSLLSVVEQAIAGGVGCVQLRDKHASDEQILQASELLKPVCARSGVLLLINDRPDLAAAAQVDGVHVGQDDAAVVEARVAVGDGMLIGLSTHSPEQVIVAQDSGADYIGVGPVYATPTKAGRTPVGTQLVTYAAANSQLPFVAIGGIDLSNVGDVVAAGAKRVAVVRAICDNDDPQVAASALNGAVFNRISQSLQ